VCVCVCVNVQAVREESSGELILCVAYVFEVLTNHRPAPQHLVYRLVGH